jgi:hypothetical protein
MNYECISVPYVQQKRETRFSSWNACSTSVSCRWNAHSCAGSPAVKFARSRKFPSLAAGVARVLQPQGDDPPGRRPSLLLRSAQLDQQLVAGRLPLT